MALAFASHSNAAPTTATTTTTTPQTTPANAHFQLFANARLQLRDRTPQGALRLWLVHNTLADSGLRPTHDGDFASVVWAALGETGLCPDGFPDDVHGAGLWPLALHNWLLKNMNKSAQELPDAWSAFAGGMQQRPVSLFDVLSTEELGAVRFTRGRCLGPWLWQVRSPNPAWPDLDDRLVVGAMMRDLLVAAETSLVRTKVEGTALLAVRRFDLETALVRLEAAKRREQTSTMDQVLRAAGVSSEGRFTLSQQREAAFGVSAGALLWRKAMQWPASEWLSLSTQRRLSLFREADVGLNDWVARERVILNMIDANAARNNGPELSSWLGFAGRAKRRHVDSKNDASDNELDEDRARLLKAIVEGERGERLLGVEGGFRERSVVALYRGVAFLKAGDTMQALRSFAFALGHADESVAAEEVHGLSRRWLAFVLAQFAADDEVLAVLDRFVPPVDHAAVVETLLWRAALHGDTKSYDKLLAEAQRRRQTTLITLGKRLAPLAAGDLTALWAQVTTDQSDSAILRFIERLLDQLALETVDVRANHRDTLAGMVQLLNEQHERATPSQLRRLERVRDRAITLRNDVGDFDLSVAGRVQMNAPGAEAYAGSVRLAPADPLPWPFAVPSTTPPNPFTPIALTPVEWRASPKGELVFGWSIHE